MTDYVEYVLLRRRFKPHGVKYTELIIVVKGRLEKFQINSILANDVMPIIQTRNFPNIKLNLFVFFFLENISQTTKMNENKM